MAWRIGDYLVRGEIDNCTRGRVTGRLWFAGRSEPVDLDLAGDTWRDLAGRRLAFTNFGPKPGLPAEIAARQTGRVGDITASRKVKVPEIPLEKIGEYFAARKAFPWHWGNSLYLEWFSDTNGRVVIESAGYELTITGDAAWDMTPEEEERQRRANGEAIAGFMEQMGETPDGAAPPDASGDQDRPQTEEEAERMLEEGDRLSDRIEARLAREGPEADYETILEEELERRRQERGEPPLTPEEEARRSAWIDEMNRLAEEALASGEWNEKEDRKHPLAERASEFSVRVHREVRDHGWRPAGAGPEHPVEEIRASAMKAAAKLAGAFNGREYPPALIFCGQTIAFLKRAADAFSDVQLAIDACAEEKLIEQAWLDAARREVAALAEETDRIIGELRARLQGGVE